MTSETKRRLNRLEMYRRPEVVGAGMEAFYRHIEVATQGGPPNPAMGLLESLYCARELKREV